MLSFFKNKRVIMATSLLIGVLMLSVPTFADIAAKSGYDKMKDSIKLTADTLCTKANNYTAEISMTIKDNDRVISTWGSQMKVDNRKKAIENIETNKSDREESKRYSYMDTKQRIYQQQDGSYSINEYSEESDFSPVPTNPFNEKSASDMEKIFDAAVGGLKDNVLVQEKSEGIKVFTGSINENQVPTLINTVCSYIFKNELSRSVEMNIPLLTNDVYIKNVSGKANTIKDGILESLFGTFTLSGKDDKGEVHNIVFELLVNVSNFNSTAVNAPDLTGKKVEKNVIQSNSHKVDTTMFVGKYKQDIVIKESGKFIKIGERFVVLSHIDSKTIEGRFYEEYIGDYAKDAKPVEFTFAATLENNNADIKSTTADGKKVTGNIHFQQENGNIYFNTNVKSGYNLFNDGEYNRVFEK